MSELGIQSLATVVLGGATFLWVAHRGRNHGLRPPLLSLLGFLMLWMGGKGVMEVPSSDAGARAGLLVSYFGACGLGPSWLYLAARFTRSQLFERQPGILVAAGVVPAIAYLALLTNDGHRLWASSLSPEVMQQSPTTWGGPIYWMALAWQFFIVVVGAVMFLRSGTGSRVQQRRARSIALIAVLPVAVTITRQLDLLPAGFNPVPLMTGLAVAAIVAVAVRYRLLDFLPLARRDVIDAISDAVILADGEGLILDLNPAAETLLGNDRAPRDRPLARTLAHLSADDDIVGTERNIEEALAAGEPCTLALRTRLQRDLEIQMGSVRDAEGEPTARYAVVRDVTEWRRYERMLRESQQRVVVGGLAAGLAHEVNNPLAFVASNLQQVHRAVTFQPGELESFEKNRAVELAELAEVVGETIEGVERIAEIVGRIIRPGTLSEDDLVRLDLARVIEDTVRLVGFHGESTVRTQIEPMDALPQVDGCPERLSQALLNLLLNAQQAAGGVKDGSLSISASADGAGVALRLGLRDADGAPFSGNVAPQAASSATAEAELSAAYETVREHGGSLESGSDPGVLFVLRLPAAA